MTPDQLRRAAPSMPPDLAARVSAAIVAACAPFGISTAVDQASYTAQMLHESCGFTRMTESLNYLPENLQRTWPKRFTPELASLYGRTGGRAANQQMIANIAYANRYGNGSVESGDGWRFRGRGPGQLTFKDNYQRCGAAIGRDLVANPDLVASIEVGALAFAWFWKTNGLSALANSGQVDHISTIVNGGDLGLQERRDLTAACVKAMA